MDKSQIKLTDLKRIFIGDAPMVYMIEVFCRTVIIYAFLLMLMRWLGKRMSGQLTIIDLSITIMLGAIVAPPMEMPDRGIIQGIMILFLILFFHRGLSLWGVKNSKVEDITFGKMSILVKDGLMVTEELKKTRISRGQLYSLLRQKKIFNLGEVERVYLEACGIFSIFKMEKAKPGLSLLPQKDEQVHSYQQQVADDVYACKNCGATQQIIQADTTCANCGEKKWDKAVI
ncbi:DUF421 domain-containing protein [Chitinophaga silvisoli]|uniref:DUF421 domain-containing protein n=1 Tax=Chitinophaga silvisoli TaxID=2291814 RepID=A0A3E1P1N3_9BACT|nr:YetF domain-containing protein [Chitinophaga silvisoli]RFM34089.1 DUF421 domain-containing protein [Chitinophaga silvisoli]